VVYSILATTLNPFFDSPLHERFEALPNLVAYVERMTARFYPEHARMAA
jgi:hypothetical protein